MNLGQAGGCASCCVSAQLHTREPPLHTAAVIKHPFPLLVEDGDVGRNRGEGVGLPQAACPEPTVNVTTTDNASPCGVTGAILGGAPRLPAAQLRENSPALSQAQQAGADSPASLGVGDGPVPPHCPTASLTAAVHPANCQQEIGLAGPRAAHRNVAVISALAHPLQAGVGTASFAPATLPGGVVGVACTAATSAQVGSGWTSTNSGTGLTVSALETGASSLPSCPGVRLPQDAPGGTDGGGPAASRHFARKGGWGGVGFNGMGSHPSGLGGGDSIDGTGKISTDGMKISTDGGNSSPHLA
jgi:hypothetical protein